MSHIHYYWRIGFNHASSLVPSIFWFGVVLDFSKKFREHSPFVRLAALLFYFGADLIAVVNCDFATMKLLLLKLCTEERSILLPKYIYIPLKQKNVVWGKPLLIY